MHADLHKQGTHIDMQKIMMAVLQALQDERDRAVAAAEEIARPVEAPT